jgi:phenolic acid decarboxylase
MYDSFPGEIPLIHATNSKYVYYDKYNIPLVLNITYAPKPGISSDDLILGLGVGIGNLNFSTQMTNIGSASVTFDLNSSENF